MIWLSSITDEILAARAFPGEERRALLLWVNELSIICDAHVPRAPAPELVLNDNLLQVNWTLNDRYFAVGVGAGLRLLLTLNDPHGSHHQEEPTHQQLKSHVLSLFEGWRP